MARQSPGIKRKVVMALAVIVFVLLILQNFHRFLVVLDGAELLRLAFPPSEYDAPSYNTIAGNHSVEFQSVIHDTSHQPSSSRTTTESYHQLSTSSRSSVVARTNQNKNENMSSHWTNYTQSTNISHSELVGKYNSKQFGNESSLLHKQDKDNRHTRKRTNPINIPTRRKVIQLAHILNPYAIGVTTTSSHIDRNTTSSINTTTVTAQNENPFFPFDQAQNITISSMIRARSLSLPHINITFYGAIFPDEIYILPPTMGFEIIFLNRSTMTDYPHILPRRNLPFVNDIFQRVYKSADFEYLIYTNTDIGLHESFYNTVANIIETKELLAFTINRRSILTKRRENDNVLLTAKDLDLIYNMLLDGTFHPGKDCFVIHRDLLPRLSLGNLFLGFPPWGRALDHILKTLVPENRHFNYNSDLNATFHLGHDLNWHEENADVSVVVDQRLKKQISACPPIQWKLRQIKRMTPLRLQNTLNCAALFENDKNETLHDK